MQLLVIVHNCVRDPDLPHLYMGYIIKWGMILSHCIKSTHSTMRIFTRFILGYAKSRLFEDESCLLDMSRNDWNLVIQLFDDCCKLVGSLEPIFHQLSLDDFNLKATPTAELSSPYPQVPSIDVAIDTDESEVDKYSLSYC